MSDPDPQPVPTWDDPDVTWDDPNVSWDGGEPADPVPPPPPPEPPPERWRPVETRPHGQLVLELDGGPRLDLADLRLLHVVEVDYGFPEVRADEQPRPNAHGTIDKTKFFGSRVVTMSGKIGVGTPSGPGGLTGDSRRQQIADRFAPFLMPDRRPWLYSIFDDGRTRRIPLRADQWSRPQIANVQDWSCSWKCPGFWEDEPTTVRVFPEVDADGWTYDRPARPDPAPDAERVRRYGPDNAAHPPYADPHVARQYPAGGGTLVWVNNLGQVPAEWEARIWGPIHGAGVEKISTGRDGREARQEFRFMPWWHLDDGESIVVSTRDRSVLVDGIPGASRWGGVDFGISEWWQLPAGRSAIRLRAEWWTAPARMEFTWRSTYLL